MASGAVCVVPGKLPANVIVAPNSPRARDQASTPPAASDGPTRGSVTRRKTVQRPAPSVRAASSNRTSMERSPASTVITRNGIATKLSATMTPGVVNGRLRPVAPASGAPSRPRRPNASRSATPPTTGGSTIGSVVSPRTLSGGQQQRVALARALATDPRLLLLDEPLAALDVSTRAEVRRDLRRHLRAFPGVNLLVTHDPLEAIALADRLIVIEQGRIVQAGTPSQVTEQPRSAYVADLVGVNLLRGTAAGGAIELEGGGRLEVVGGGGGEVFAVIPPRSVSLWRSRPDGSPRNVWRGRAAGLDLLGDRVRVRVAAQPQPTLVAEVTPAAVAELALAEGSEVWVSIKATEVRLYPA